MSAPWLRTMAGAVEVRVRVVPRSSKNRIVGLLGDQLKLQVTAPPVEGEANQAVLQVVAESAGVPTRSASLVGGSRGRSKTVRLTCEEPEYVAGRLKVAVAAIR